MSNPVVFFDMEIGGQPAGRIEMTVRLLANTPFPFLGKNTTTLSDLFFFFCDDFEEEKNLDRHFLDRFFFTVATIRLRHCACARCVVCRTNALSRFATISTNTTNTNNYTTQQRLYSSERTCARKRLKTSVNCAPGNPDSGTKRRRFIASFLASCAKEVILRTKTERAESPSTGTSSRTKTLRSSTRDQGFCPWPTRGRTRTGRSFSCARRRRLG